MSCRFFARQAHQNVVRDKSRVIESEGDSQARSQNSNSEATRGTPPCSSHSVHPEHPLNAVSDTDPPAQARSGFDSAFRHEREMHHLPNPAENRSSQPAQLQPKSYHAASPAQLPPEWVAILSIHWRSAPAAEKTQALHLVEQILDLDQRSAEDHDLAIHHLQKAMRTLGLTEFQVIRLILTRYLDLNTIGMDQPANEMARQLQQTLLSFQPGRSN